MPRPDLELLAPARDADIGIEAINHGADAVYIGGPAFGAPPGASPCFISRPFSAFRASS